MFNNIINTIVINNRKMCMKFTFYLISKEIIKILIEINGDQHEITLNTNSMKTILTCNALCIYTNIFWVSLFNFGKLFVSKTHFYISFSRFA